MSPEKLITHIAFLNEIESKIQEAFKIIENIDDMNYIEYTNENYRLSEHNAYSEQLEDYIKDINISVSLLLESAGFSITAQILNTELSKFTKNLSKVSMSNYAGVLCNEPLLLLFRNVKGLSFLLKGEQNKSIAIGDSNCFERILKNTPHIIHERGIEPRNEAEVRKCIYNTLIHTFPDTVREIPISQVSKTYKPDLGVRSLKTAAEYKFADSIEEVKKSIEGFFADMHGYSGSSDWTKFYAVLYTTSPIFTQAQLEAEFDLTNADKNWIPILVHGVGKRIKNTKKHPPK